MKLKNKLILAYGLLHAAISLQSCSSIGSNKSNINPIKREDLLRENLLERRERKITAGQIISVLQENQPMLHEVRGKLGRLRNEGFLDHYANYSDMREGFMFVFSHWLGCKQTRSMSVQDKIGYFQALPDTPNLVWKLVYNRREDKAEFQLKNIYSRNNDYGLMNLNNSGRLGKAPLFDFGEGEERIEIDHLVRNNRVTIELPYNLHKIKTRFIDNLTNIPKRSVNRDSESYWKSRAIASGYNPRPVGRPPRA